MKAVIVSGDRHATEQEWTGAVLGALWAFAGEDKLIVISGGATGIDALAHDIAQHHHDAAISMPAQWHVHGKSAGPKRNVAMLQVLKCLRDHGHEVAVLAFHNDLAASKGTAHMVNIATGEGFPVRVFDSAERLVSA